MSRAPAALQPLHYTVRRSPYFPRTVELGAIEFMVYNHMYMPLDYGRDPREDYDALVERVTLWDVGAERQTELRGRDALRLADHLSPRDLSGMRVGDCRFSPVCDDRGQIMADCIVLRPEPDVVWFSHGDVDYELWAYGLARAGGFEVAVSEADVPPLQLQGPLAAAVLEPICALDVAGLPRFRCAITSVGGVPAVVSNTGWSREAGFEIYPLGSERALEVWDAIVDAGQAHGLLVTGPNIVRAVEQGITDTQYRMNSGMNPIEAGMEAMIDLDGADFVGRDALRAVRHAGARRRTIGLLVHGDPVPRLDDFWPVLDDRGRQVGVARWAVWSYALETSIAIVLVDAELADPQPLILRAPDGDRRTTRHPIPFV
jgi:glycine cleavage system aminomethyltransferase T